MNQFTKSLLTYVAMLGALAAALVAVLRVGAQNHGAGSQALGQSKTLLATLHEPLSLLLMQVVVIVVAARLTGWLFRRFGQPAVIGEMFVGIALGPSLLGWTAPEVSKFLFPPDKGALTSLQMLSQVGILLFMFIVGMELDPRLIKQKAQSAILISHTSILLPFALGCTAALFLYKEYMGAHTTFLPFALFMGISMSITAFPVLARIIQERGLSGSALGNTAVTCAAVDDITAWTALAFIVALARSQGLGASAITLCLALVYVGVMISLVRPLFIRLVDKSENAADPGPNMTVAVLATVFVSALFTEAIGIHALFGAFFAGAIMPPSEEFRKFLHARLEYFSGLFLLPIFFVFTGLRTQIGLLSGAHDYLICAGLLCLAVLGKFGGSTLAGRVTGMSWKESVAIGALMNTRGLVELIALNLGLDLGVLSPKIFAMLVVMALVTTFMTGPVMHFLRIGSMQTGRVPSRTVTAGAKG